MELEKFEQKQVAAISELQTISDGLNATAKVIVVSDNDTLKEASQLVKDINAHKKLVKEKRLALTQPLDAVVKQLIAKEKEVLLPLDEGKSEVSTKILDYQEEVERKRLEEIARVDEIVENIESFHDHTLDTIDKVDERGKEMKRQFENLPEADKNNPSIKVAFMATVGRLTDRKNQIIEEERAEKERQRQAEEQKRLDAEREKQSAEEARIAAERKANEDAQREIEEQKAQIKRDKEELERAKELQKAEAEQLKLEKEAAKKAAATPKTNAIVTTKFEITDESLVDHLLCSPDEKKIREAIKAGATELAGIRIFTEKKVR